MSDLADTLRQLGKEYGQAGGYIHLELADKADKLEESRDRMKQLAYDEKRASGKKDIEIMELKRERDEYEQALTRVKDLAELLRGGRRGLVTYQILSAIKGGTANIENWPNE